VIQRDDPSGNARDETSTFQISASLNSVEALGVEDVQTRRPQVVHGIPSDFRRPRMRPRLTSAVLAAAAGPLLLAGCGSSGSVEEFCAVWAQVDDAEGPEDGLPLLADLEDAAPTDRLEDSVGTLRDALEDVGEDGDLSDVDPDDLPDVQRAGEFIESYVDQNCES
jgi:hypothetical protein